MTYKRRLVSSRQGFVFVTFMTPICCVSVMWITGSISGGPAHRRTITPARFHHLPALAGRAAHEIVMTATPTDLQLRLPICRVIGKEIDHDMHHNRFRTAPGSDRRGAG